MYVIIDLHMTASANGDLNPLTIGRPTVAISLAIDEIAMEQAERLGAVKFIDKMELAKELVPTLLQFAPSNKPSQAHEKKSREILNLAGAKHQPALPTSKRRLPLK